MTAWRDEVVGQGPARIRVCRAGFAGRGTPLARIPERYTLAFAPDPKRRLGSDQ